MFQIFIKKDEKCKHIFCRPLISSERKMNIRWEISEHSLKVIITLLDIKSINIHLVTYIPNAIISCAPYYRIKHSSIIIGKIR